MWASLQLAFSLGFTIALPLVIGTAAGVWLDVRMNTMPILTIGGTIFGMIFAGAFMMKKILPFLEKRSPK